MKKLIISVFLISFILLFFFYSCKPTPTGPISKNTPTFTKTMLITLTSTDTFTQTPTQTITATLRDTIYLTHTVTITATATLRETLTQTLTQFEIETLTPTLTITNTQSYLETYTYTPTITTTPTCIIYYYDADKDGFGTDQFECLYGPTGLFTAPSTGDCDDNDPKVHPGAYEICNDIDDNCNGIIDEEGAIGCVNYYIDMDADGYGNSISSKCLCSPSGVYRVTNPDDCNDYDSQVHPSMLEICPNGKDDNCDGLIDNCGP